MNFKITEPEIKNLIWKKVESINAMLLQNAPSYTNIGLMNGKLGLCIYFFLLARQTKSPEHQDVAEKLIEEVYQTLNESKISSDFENGMAGIAWGITFLVKNGFVEADLDDILSDVDDRIYKYLIEVKENLPIGLNQGIMGYTLYLCYRLEEIPSPQHKLNHEVLRMLLIDLINQMGQLIEEGKINTAEPPLFNLNWDLPLALILLSKCKALNIHSIKIDRILDYLTPVVVSLYPYLESNKLYLLLGLESVLQKDKRVKWREHADLLRINVKLPKITDEECRSLNVLFMNGIPGIGLINRKLYQITKDASLVLPEEKLLAKIMTSECWSNSNHLLWIKENIGLMNGMPGLGLFLLELLSSVKNGKYKNC